MTRKSRILYLKQTYDSQSLDLCGKSKATERKKRMREKDPHNGPHNPHKYPITIKMNKNYFKQGK